jgi:acyl dehydratase
MSAHQHHIDQLPSLEGQHLGYSDWEDVDQSRIDLFAEATGDHQWIHVDPTRAAAGPFGTTIAHGYLTLSLLPALLQQIEVVSGVSFAVNYGCNRVRFPSPVPVGSAVRLGLAIAAVEDVGGGVQVTYDATVEVRDSAKPSLVAQVLYRYYR